MTVGSVAGSPCVSPPGVVGLLVGFSITRAGCSDEIDEDTDGLREEVDRRLERIDVIEVGTTRPLFSSGNSCGALPAERKLLVDKGCRTCGEPEIAGRTPLRPGGAGTARLLYIPWPELRPRVGVVARWMSSGGGGDIGRGGGPMFGGPGLLIEGGGGGRRGGGGSIIVGGRVRSIRGGGTGDSVPEGTRERDASSTDAIEVEVLTRERGCCAVFASRSPGFAIVDGKAMVLVPGDVGEVMNWNCCA